jgi:hypothetical protein
MLLPTFRGRKVGRVRVDARIKINNREAIQDRGRVLAAEKRGPNHGADSKRKRQTASIHSGAAG